VDYPEKDAIFMEHVKKMMNIPSYYNLNVPNEIIYALFANPKHPIYMPMSGYDTSRLMEKIEKKKDSKLHKQDDPKSINTESQDNVPLPTEIVHATSDTPDDAISYEDKLKIEIASNNNVTLPKKIMNSI